MYIRQTKNDSKDCFLIAQVMRFGQYSQRTLSDENIVAMKQLTAIGVVARKMCNIFCTILRENRPCEAMLPKKAKEELY